MDWIERLFGFAPDNGDGSVELMIVLGATIAAFVAVALHPRMRQAALHFLGRIRAGLTRSR